MCNYQLSTIHYQLLKMQRIILLYPFIRHYAGSVFDLEENPNFPDEYDDIRVRDRIDFWDKRTYILPDGGKGNSTNLAFTNTTVCPSEIFEKVDLKTGPCRITSAKTQANDAAAWQLTIEKAALIDAENQEKQGILIELPTHSPHPQRVQVVDRQSNQMLKNEAVNAHLLRLDFSDFTVGFYEISVLCEKQTVHILTFIKCFPLVVEMKEGTYDYTTMKTIW